MVERKGSHWEWEPGGGADSRDSWAVSAGEALQSLEGRDVAKVTSQTPGPAKAGAAAYWVSPQILAVSELWKMSLSVFISILYDNFF